MCKLASPFSTVRRCANDLRLTCQVKSVAVAILLTLRRPPNCEALIRTNYECMRALRLFARAHTHTQQRKGNLLPGIIAVHYAAFAPDSFLITSAPIVPNSMRQSERSAGRKQRFVFEERVRSKCN
jgi:hypothetical protein